MKRVAEIVQTNGKNLLTTDRRARIIALLDDKGQVQVRDLSEQFGVSAVTIRNDLAHLEANNLLVRTQGGAFKQLKVAMDLAISEKARKNYKQKKRIGQKAAEFVHDGDTIILDSGTTTMEIAKLIKTRLNLTVITHALNIATELAGSEDVDVIMPGGTLRTKSFSLVGSRTERDLREYFCDRYFLGVDGFDTTTGVSTPSVAEAQVNRVMADISREVIVVLDSSKFGRRFLATLLPVDRIHKVITDTDIPEDDRERLLEQSIDLIIV